MTKTWLLFLIAVKKQLLYHLSNNNYNEHLARIVPLSAASVSLAVYLATLLPEVDWGDSAELSVQAYQLGVTHPPGYPVHTLLGKLLISLSSTEPAFATNLLSVLFTGLAVGLLSLIAIKITSNWYASFFAGLIFAFLPGIWEMAITTEVYNVNIGILALALSLILFRHHQSSIPVLYLAAVLLGVSLGSYLANILILPAFVFLALRPRRTNLIHIVLFLAVLVIVGGLILSWNYLRSRTIPPIGTEFIPNSLNNFILFLTGAQYKTMDIHSPGFYYNRFVEHAQIFRHSFTWLGVGLGLLGLISLWKKQRSIFIGLLLIFIVNMGYFTGYKVHDYYNMVTPSYLVFSLWIAYGIYFLARQLRRVKAEFVAVVIPIALLIGLMYPQLGPRLARSRGTPVTDFVLASFRILPPNAIAVTNWNQFTALSYFQKTHGLRQDLTIIEYSNAPRYYSFGMIAGWPDHIIYATTVSKSLVVYGIEDSIRDTYQLRYIGNGWYQVILKPQLQRLARDVDTLTGSRNRFDLYEGIISRNE